MMASLGHLGGQVAPKLPPKWLPGGILEVSFQDAPQHDVIYIYLVWFQDAIQDPMDLVSRLETKKGIKHCIFLHFFDGHFWPSYAEASAADPWREVGLCLARKKSSPLSDS